GSSCVATSFRTAPVARYCAPVSAPTPCPSSVMKTVISTAPLTRLTSVTSWTLPVRWTSSWHGPPELNTVADTYCSAEIGIWVARASMTGRMGDKVTATAIATATKVLIVNLLLWALGSLPWGTAYPAWQLASTKKLFPFNHHVSRIPVSQKGRFSSCPMGLLRLLHADSSI